MAVSTLRDSKLETRVYTARALLVAGLVLLLLGVLLARYARLQIADYDVYRAASDRNRVQLQSLPPPRGLILDRNGVLLAENRPSHVLSVVVERVNGLDETLEQLSGLVPLTPEDLEKFQRRLERRRPWEPVPLYFRLSEEERARLAVNRHRLPGVVVDAQLVRHYTQGELFSHVLGYVGRINREEQAQVDQARYRGVNHIGKIGLEKHYENILLGKVGYQNVEINAQGRVLRVLERTAPTPGEDLGLALDGALQRVAHDALEGRRGAVVALDPRNGEVLVLVSAPGFDTNLFVNGISVADFGALRDSRHLPLFNRAVQGQYPPGSTMKPVFGLAGLEAGAITPEFTLRDPGWYSLPGDQRRFRDWTLRVRGSGHGPAVDLHQAIAESCDVYFYDLAHRMGVEPLAEFAARFGLGAATGLDSTHEQAGVLPTPEWKQRSRGQVWFPGDTINMGIGQGHMLTTPLQLAVMTAALANGGKRYPPRLLRTVGGNLSPPPEPVQVQAGVEHWEVIRLAMRDVFHGEAGTARLQGRGASVIMAGKSGTAQVVGIAQDAEYEEEEVAEEHRDHALFIAFAPYDEPEIALAVVVENAGSGSTVAAPVARAVIEAHQELRGRALRSLSLRKSQRTVREAARQISRREPPGT